MVRIVLALLSLLTAPAAGPGRPGAHRAQPGPARPAPARPGVSPRDRRRPCWPARRPGGAHRPAGHPAGGRTAGRTGRPPRMAT